MKRTTIKEYEKRKAELLENLEKVLPFENDTEEKKKERLKKSEKDFFYFCRTYLPHYFTDESCDFHIELIDMIENKGKSKNKIIPVAAPRGHAKSTHTTFAYPLWAAIFKKENNIVIISTSEDAAEDFTSRIKIEFEHNERLLHDFGKFKIDGGDSKFTINDEVRLSAFGKGQNIRVSIYRQYRPSLIICDDLEDDKGVLNPEQREKLWKWLYSAVLPTLEPKKGKIFVIGTILHHDSLLRNLIKKYNGVIYKAIKEDGNPLWADRFPIELLESLREEMGSTMFSQEYQNEPIDYENQVFKTETLHTFQTINEETRKFRYIDPAVGKNKKSDYHAVINGEVGLKTKTIYVVEIFLKKTTFQKMMDYVLEDYKLKRQEKTAMEAIAFQEIGKQWIDEKSKELGLYMPIAGHIPKGSKESRIEGLVPLWENGTIKVKGEIVNKEFVGAADMKKLIEQFEQYPKGKNDDGPDAVAGLVDTIRHGSTAYAYSEKSEEDKGFLRKLGNTFSFWK